MTGARFTEAELQQAVMAAKREHKESVEALRKEQDEALFKLRGEQAVLSQHYVETIQRLEEEVKLLKKSARSSSTTDAEPAAAAAAAAVAAAASASVPRASPDRREAEDVSRAVSGRVSEVVRQEVPDTFVEFTPKGVHKGIQVDMMTSSEETLTESKAVKMVTKGIQVKTLYVQD